MTIRIEIIVMFIVILAGGIGWLINRLIVSIKELIDVVNDFRVAMATLKEEALNSNTNCGKMHSNIETRLNTHSSKIEAHGIILAEHEVKIKELLK